MLNCHEQLSPGHIPLKEKAVRSKIYTVIILYPCFFNSTYLHGAEGDFLRSLIEEDMKHVQKLSLKFSTTLYQFIK